MSTENNTNEQNVVKRRGPDPRFVWGLVAVIVLGVILCAGFMKFEDMSDQLTKAQTERVQAQTELAQANQEIKDKIENIQQLESKKLELEQKLEQSVNEYTAKVKKLTEDKSNLENEEALFRLSTFARRIVCVDYDGTKSIAFAFRWCPPGTFMMGSPDSEEGRENNETQHKVTLTKGFWMLETEVTVGMFEAFVNDSGYKNGYITPQDGGARKYVRYQDGKGAMELDPNLFWKNPGFSQNSNHPVTCVSWNDAVEFCKWLSKKTGHNIQLPTEAQWEYACRAGTTGRFAGELSEMVTNYVSQPPAVGSKKPNEWGIYDMHSNVTEWCLDWYDDYSKESVKDPSGPADGGKYKIHRGGSWLDPREQYQRSAFRGYIPPEWKAYNFGFRIVLIP